MLQTPVPEKYDRDIFMTLLSSQPIVDLNDAGVETPRGAKRRYNNARYKYIALVSEGFIEAVVAK